MMFSLLFTKSITDLVEWLEKKVKKHELDDGKNKRANVIGLQFCCSDRR